MPRQFTFPVPGNSHKQATIEFNAYGFKEKRKTPDSQKNKNFQKHTGTPAQLKCEVSTVAWEGIS